MQVIAKFFINFTKKTTSLTFYYMPTVVVIFNRLRFKVLF